MEIVRKVGAGKIRFGMSGMACARWDEGVDESLR